MARVEVQHDDGSTVFWPVSQDQADDLVFALTAEFGGFETTIPAPRKD